MSHQLTVENVFPTLVYKIDKPEFLSVTKTVSLESLEKRHQEVELNEAFPCYMTESLNVDPRMLDFGNYVAQTAWNILQEQGYDVGSSNTYFTEMWCQEHHKGSLMEQHIHGQGIQIVGFYFLDVPDDDCRVMFYDPRAGKVQADLPQSNVNNLTPASSMANYQVKAGTLMFTNAWLPHSFSRVTSEQPIRFIHFNIGVKQNSFICCPPKAEVI